MGSSCPAKQSFAGTPLFPLPGASELPRAKAFASGKNACTALRAAPPQGGAHRRRPVRLWLKAPLIPVSPHGGDISRICGIVFDFDTQASDVYVHDLQLAEVVPSPHRVENFLPGEGFSRVVHKQLYDGVLHLCKLDPLSRVRLRVFSRKGGWLISPVSTGSPPPVRR